MTRINQTFDGFQYIESYRCQFEPTENTKCETVVEDIYQTDVSNLTYCKTDNKTFHSFKDELTDGLTHKSSIEDMTEMPANIVFGKQTKEWIVFLRTCRTCEETVRLTYKYRPKTVRV